MSSPLISNKDVLTDAEYELCFKLESEHNQAHLFANWPAAGKEDADKKGMAAQLMKLDKDYPGGLGQYVSNAVRLLRDSNEGKNPFDGFVPSVPDGERLTVETKDFDDFEAKGMSEMDGACFVLVAGGLGERLGYNGIKIELPVEVTTDMCYLQYYCECILAFQERARVSSGKADLCLPLAIMTSGDTHEKTLKLLDANEWFGMKNQLTLMKQELVPAVMDNNAKFALSDDNKYVVQTKPHGHGDVHTLLHTSGTVHKWAEQQRKWVCFFQDTNAMVMRAFPAAIGVSAKRDFVVNSLTVSRAPGEAVGAICKLSNEQAKKEMILSVEYNQLDPLLRATVSPEGDIADEATGFSPYPGNINVLVFKLQPFAKILEETNGGVPEFVNPKYADEAKTQFKKPTRLECMMQELPRLLAPGTNVGFTQMERWISFSAVKNKPADAVGKLQATGYPECASSGESDMYALNRRILGMAGVKLTPEDELKKAMFLDLPFVDGARVVLGPRFGTTVKEVRDRFVTPEKVTISSRSSLVIDGDVEIHQLTLDGDLVLRAAPGAKIVIKKLAVQNKGSELVAPASNAEEKYVIRGYQRKINNVLDITKSGPGEVVLEKTFPNL